MMYIMSVVQAVKRYLEVEPAYGEHTSFIDRARVERIHVHAPSFVVIVVVDAAADDAADAADDDDASCLKRVGAGF